MRVRRPQDTNAVSMDSFEHGFLRGCFFIDFGHPFHGYLHFALNSRPTRYRNAVAVQVVYSQQHLSRREAGVALCEPPSLLNLERLRLGYK